VEIHQEGSSSSFKFQLHGPRVRREVCVELLRVFCVSFIGAYTLFLVGSAFNAITMSRRNSSVVAIDAEQARRLSLAMTDIKQVNHDAGKATRSEQNMTLRQGIKLYPKAIAWSVLLSAAIIMEVSPSLTIRQKDFLILN
jgi:hypothetical protein